jgi:hypothetical protein
VTGGPGPPWVLSVAGATIAFEDGPTLEVGPLREG